MNIITTDANYDYNTLTKDTEKLLKEFHFLKKVHIGMSVLGKELFCLKFGKGDKKIFINGAHHGKEWITSLLTMLMTERLSMLYASKTSAGGYDISDLYERTTLYVCPMVNPDGVDLSIKGLSDDIKPIFKNRLISYNNSSRDFVGKWQANANGVDLNHNYDAGFLHGKAQEASLKIFSPCSSRFSGTSPLSEPESAAIAAFTVEIMPDICVAYHSQGEEIYYDFDGKMAKGSEKIARDMAEISGYKALKPEGMASFSGFKDWVIDKFSVPAFTIEVGRGENPLPISDIDEIFEKNFPVLLYLMNL